MEEILYKLYPFTSTLPPIDWLYFYQRIRSTLDLPNDLRADGTAALAFLEKELGTGFFNTCGRNHPVRLKLMMAGAAGQIAELVKWVRVLQKLKAADSNYPKLLQKLHSKSEARAEAIPFIDVSARHLDQSFSVCFPKEIQDQKNPDLELTFAETGEKIYVEVTRISEGADQEKKERFYHSLLHLFQWSGCNALAAGKLHEQVPDELLKQLTEKLKAMMAEAARDVSLVTYQDPYLSVAFAHPDRLDELYQWCAERKLRRHFDGFDVEFDYTRRIIKNSRIHKEAKQIPKGQTGIIYFPVHILYPLTMNVAETVAAYVRELEQYRHIFGLVFYGEVLPPPDEPFTVENECFVYALRWDKAHIARYTLLIKNPSFDLQLSAAAKTALVNAAI